MDRKAESDADRASKCPRCGGVLQAGYVLAPRGLWWDIEPHKVSPVSGTSLQIIRQFGFVNVPSAPAQRCVECGTIVI